MSYYCIDTSALIEAWERRYSPDVFPGLWRKLEELVKQRKLVAPEEVQREALKKAEVAQWTQTQTGLFIPVDERQQEVVTDILARFPKLVKVKTGKGAADPWLIALAYMEERTLVTQEVATGKAADPHIPDVCKAYGVPCINILELFRREKWSFP